ncbi:MAG: DMT family transporter [Rhodospirillaceae bacterium]
MIGQPLAFSATRNSVGIALITFGYLLASASDSAVKWVSGGYPVSEIVFFSAMFSLVPFAVAVVAGGGIGVLTTRRLKLHMLRGALSLCSTFSGYYALGHMALADFYAVVFTAPLFITSLSVPINGERVDLSRWLAVVAGFVGVLIMVRPGGDVAGLGALGALGAAFFYALAVLVARRMGDTESGASFGFYGNLVLLAGAGSIMLSEFVSPPPLDLLALALAGIGMGAFLLLLFAACRRTPASVLAPFQYTQIIWGVLIGFLVFGERPEVTVAVGGVLVVGSGLFILYRETCTVSR